MRSTPWLVPAFVALMTLGRSAHAFCRTTTEAGATQACTTDGAPLYWRNECRGMRMDLAGVDASLHAAYTASLENALAQWNRPSCPDGSGKASIAIEYLGPTDEDYVGYVQGEINENAIFFRGDEWAYADSNQVALTTVTFRSDTGEILDADMEVNATLDISAADPLPRRGFDLDTVFAHELGHVLGLAHSDDRGATMFATYNPGTTDQASLEDDDRAGLCAAYPADGTRVTAAVDLEPTSCDAEDDAGNPDDGAGGGCGCHTRRGPSPGDAASLLVPLALVALARRRAARR